MPSPSPEALEGRILGQRKVLAEILARLARQDPTLLDALADREVVSDHEEDPGVADLSPAFAIEAALADEIRLILEAARGRMGGRTGAG